MRMKGGSKLSNVVKNASNHDVLVIVLTSLLLAALLYMLFTDPNPFCNELFTESSVKKTIYVFLMDGCGWCDKFKPEVGVLTSKISSDPSLQQKFDVKIVNFPSVSSAEKQLMRDFSIEAFPSVVVATSDTSKFWTYHGSEERTAAKVLQWAQSVDSPQ